MVQSAADTPIHSLQRKAAIAGGGAFDHTGSVLVKPLRPFDLNRTIFNTLEGAIPRYVIKTRIAKAVEWHDAACQSVENAYRRKQNEGALPPVDIALLTFMSDECDFDVEHADGSFLDHLYFCYEYTHHHFPQHSPLVMLLHSILGTGTNTFAMDAEKIPLLRTLLSTFEWTHVEAFPSILRLLYDTALRQELRRSVGRLDSLRCIHFHRVIDNEPLTLSAEDFWIQLNYQLIHLIDFLPVSNWTTHSNDTAFIIFRDLFELLVTNGQLHAKLEYEPSTHRRGLVDEKHTLGGKLTTLIPVALSEKMAAASVRRFSAKIGHSINYTIDWT